MIVFEKCDNATSSVTCKSEEDIETWIQFKYMTIAINQKKIIQHKFEEDRIDKFSQLIWFPLSSKNRVDYVMDITRTSVEFNDNYFNVGSIMSDIDQGYTVVKKPSRELPYRNNFQNSITLEPNLNRLVYYRRVYSFLDLLADLGGLAGALRIVCSLLISVFSYYSAYQFMMSELFVQSLENKETF